VRVLLLDGLGAAVADRLPELGRLCAAGLRLEVEVGFPSVSLPVQHVLWTGAWQQQSGIEFAVARLPGPVFESLPELVTRRSANAIAVVESHAEIAGSFRFSQLRGPRGSTPLTSLALGQEALAAAQTGAPLVFVHLLRIDEAGHRFGAVSAEYLAAARDGDLLLAGLRRTRLPEQTLLVLSDHGHLPEGGHGDLEPCVQRVRACLEGPGIPAGGRVRATMPDLNAILAERLGVPRPAASVGRGLAAVLEGDPPAIAAPRASALGGAIGALLALALLLVGPVLVAGGPAGRRGRVVLGLPWGMLTALLFLTAWGGPPSLSRAYVYPAVSPLLLGSALAGGLLASLQLATLRRLGASAPRALAALAAGALALPVAALLASGFPFRIPPLAPFASGWASSALGLASGILLVLGGAALGSSPPRGGVTGGAGQRGDRS
jgi:hypothetical protein